MILSGKANSNTIKWDTSEFPVICEKCLGNNPYVRMSKADFDLECKICIRPFIVFRWRSDNNKFKRTEICNTCARVKNLCQSCLLDLRFGVSMELRDKYLKEKVEIPKDITNRDYWSYKISKNIDKMDLPYYQDNKYSVLDRFLHEKNKFNNESNNNGVNYKTILDNMANNSNIYNINANNELSLNENCYAGNSKLGDILLNRLGDSGDISKIIHLEDYVSRNKLEQIRNEVKTLSDINNFETKLKATIDSKEANSGIINSGNNDDVKNSESFNAKHNKNSKKNKKKREIEKNIEDEKVKDKEEAKAFSKFILSYYSLLFKYYSIIVIIIMLYCMFLFI